MAVMSVLTCGWIVDCGGVVIIVNVDALMV